MYISIKYERYERLNNTILLFFGSCQNCMSSLILLHKSTRCIYNVTVLAILECLEFKNFSCLPTMVAIILSSVPWSLHFEIHFAGPDNYISIYTVSYPDIFSYHRISMGAQILSPNISRTGLVKRS